MRNDVIYEIDERSDENLTPGMTRSPSLKGKDKNQNSDPMLI